MQFLALGLHFGLAILCAVHAVRTGQASYWLFILFSFPGLGPLVYLLTIYLPHSKLHRKANRAVAAVGRALDPGRALREARLALEDTPSAQNRMRLAEALLADGQLDEAAATFEQCLQGPFAQDPDLRWGAAQVQLARGRADEAVRHLDGLAEKHTNFRVEAVALARARALGMLGRHEEAGPLFNATVERFGSFESKAERAIWAWQQGRPQAATWQAELDQLQRRWTAHTKLLHAEQLARLRQARGA